MFVELGATVEVWKAHMVRGILASHGIDAVLWHENAVYLYGLGWSPRCIVLVNEDDTDDAREVLRATPEPMPESEVDIASETTASRELQPDFLTLLVTGLLISFAMCFGELTLHFLNTFIESGSVPPEPGALDFVPGILFFSVMAGVAWTFIAHLMFVLLRRVPELLKTTVAITGLPVISLFIVA